MILIISCHIKWYLSQFIGVKAASYSGPSTSSHITLSFETKYRMHSIISYNSLKTIFFTFSEVVSFRYIFQIKSLYIFPFLLFMLHGIPIKVSFV